MCIDIELGYGTCQQYYDWYGVVCPCTCPNWSLGADGRSCTGIATEVSPSCTGWAWDGVSTCDLDASTDGTADCPDGCDGVAGGTPTCDLDWATDGSTNCPAGCTYNGTDLACWGTAIEVTAGTPTCDLDASTDGTADCPAGCTEVAAVAPVAAADAYIPTCDLDPSTDGTPACPAGCTEEAAIAEVIAVAPACFGTSDDGSICDLDALTDGTAECPAGCIEVVAVEAVAAVPASCTGTALEVAAVSAVAGVAASCTGTASQADSYVPTCDFDASTDGTSDCPLGCSEGQCTEVDWVCWEITEGFASCGWTSWWTPGSTYADDCPCTCVGPVAAANVTGCNPFWESELCDGSCASWDGDWIYQVGDGVCDDIYNCMSWGFDVGDCGSAANTTQNTTQGFQGACENSDTFNAGFGPCETYFPGQANHDWCAADGAIQDGACPLACGVCTPTRYDAGWHVGAANTSTCNEWQIHMHEDGWGNATIRVHDDVETLLIDGLTYNAGGVDSGVADVCLGPSRCYNIAVMGSPSARWSIYDAGGVVVEVGSAPYVGTLCHCGHRGGDPCVDCAGVSAPPGGDVGTCDTMQWTQLGSYGESCGFSYSVPGNIPRPSGVSNWGTMSLQECQALCMDEAECGSVSYASHACYLRPASGRTYSNQSTDSYSCFELVRTLPHDQTCTTSCSNDTVLPLACWNGTLSSPAQCCGIADTWDGEPGSQCSSASMWPQGEPTPDWMWPQSEPGWWTSPQSEPNWWTSPQAEPDWWMMSPDAEPEWWTSPQAEPDWWMMSPDAEPEWWTSPQAEPNALCTWQTTDWPPSPLCSQTPCVDWLDGWTGDAFCMDSCGQLGVNDMYCIGSFVNRASADGPCTYDMYASSGFDFIGDPTQIQVCDIRLDTSTPRSDLGPQAEPWMAPQSEPGWWTSPDAEPGWWTSPQAEPDWWWTSPQAEPGWWTSPDAEPDWWMTSPDAEPEWWTSPQAEPNSWMAPAGEPMPDGMWPQGEPAGDVLYAGCPTNQVQCPDGTCSLHTANCPLCPYPDCIGDVTRDLRVDVADLLTILAAFGGWDCRADADWSDSDEVGEGKVNTLDLLRVLSRYGRTC